MNDQSKRKLFGWLSLVFFVAFALSLGWGIYEFQLLKQQKIATENQYKRALNDLVGNLNEIETGMAKAKVANSTAQKVLFMGEIWKGSESAVSKFGQLPADEIGISYVDTLVNQVGDFSKTMTKKVASNGEMNAEEKETFNDMHERVIEVNRAVQQLSNQFYAENLAWVDKSPGILQRVGIGKDLQTAAKGGESAAQNPVSVRGGLKQLDASLQKYPPFSYQGELDKHYVEKPLGLTGEDIDESKAASAGTKFLKDIGYEDAKPQVTGLSQGPMGGFNLTYNESYLDISRKGGKVLFFRNQREINERKLDVNKAVDITYSTLERMGWKLVVTSTEDLDSYIQVEAIPQQNGVRLYPDKVRLTVAMDNGELIGFDANPYYAYHHDRNLNKKLTLEEAKASLDSNFKILENRVAIISRLGTEEALCYEFRGTAYGEEYLVYINAMDGAEEKINRVVDTPRGKLIQ